MAGDGVIATLTFAIDDAKVTAGAKYELNINKLVGAWYDADGGQHKATENGTVYTVDGGSITIKAAEAKTYTATFVNEAGETVGTDTFKDGDASLANVPEVPAKDGYTGAWESYTLGSSDITIKPVYTAIDYTATFVAGNDVVGTDTFNADDMTVVEPEVPAKDGYEGAWEKYELGYSDITINAVYTAIDYTASFVADGEEVGTDTFNADDMTVVAPEVPAKDGYEGAWEGYQLGYADITINAVYTAITYYATFVADGEEVEKVPYTVETQSIVAPEVPAKANYEGAWEDYTLEIGGITVNAVYTKIETYNIVWVGYEADFNAGVDCGFEGTAITNSSYVLVKGEPSKIQFIRGAVTLTFSRDNAYNTYDSVIAITPVTYVDETGMTVNAEVWEIEYDLVPGTYAARAKYGVKWDSSEFNYNFTVEAEAWEVSEYYVVDEENDTVYYTGTASTIIVKTSTNVKKVQLVTPTGATLTYNSNYVDEDGVRTWTIKRTFSTTTYSYDLKVYTSDTGWVAAEKNVSFKVIVKKNTPSADSVSGFSAAVEGRKATFTVTTSTDVAKIQLVNAATGATLTYGTGYVDADGVRTWTVSRSFSIGEYNFNLKVKTDNWSDVIEGLNAEFTVA